MSRSPTGHGFWMPASIAGDTLHENVSLGRRDILMVTMRCAEAPVLFAKRLRRDVD
jgi:hypothetical protein